MEVHVGATWLIWLNRPCAVTMRPVSNYFDHLLLLNRDVLFTIQSTVMRRGRLVEWLVHWRLRCQWHSNTAYVYNLNGFRHTWSSQGLLSVGEQLYSVWWSGDTNHSGSVTPWTPELSTRSATARARLVMNNTKLWLRGLIRYSWPPTKTLIKMSESFLAENFLRIVQLSPGTARRCTSIGNFLNHIRRLITI